MISAVLRVDGRAAVPCVELALGMRSRMVGLMGRRGLGAERALFLHPCGGIHTAFMRFSLDVAFLDREMRVLRVVRGVRPWRCVFGGARARSVIEMEAGWLPEDGLPVGATVSLDPEPCGAPRRTE